MHKWVYNCKAREANFLEMVAGTSVALARFYVHRECNPPSPLFIVAVTQRQLQTQVSVLRATPNRLSCSPLRLSLLLGF